MKTNFGLREEVADTASELQRLASDFQEDLSLFEALQIAVKIQHNRILEEALMVGSSKHPGALEAIAMALGVESDGRGGVKIDSEANGHATSY